MKGKHFRTAVVLIILLCFVGLPSLIYAQPIQEAVTAAERDAEADTNPLIWMGAGFFLGVIGVGAAYLYQPSPPLSRLMGKSPEYVAAYTDTYKRKARDIQTRNALTGCAIETGLCCTFYLCYYALLLSAVQAQY